MVQTRTECAAQTGQGNISQKSIREPIPTSSVPSPRCVAPHVASLVVLQVLSSLQKIVVYILGRGIHLPDSYLSHCKKYQNQQFKA